MPVPKVSLLERIDCKRCEARWSCSIETSGNFTATATATKTSLGKWIRAASKFIALIITSRSVRQMLANFLELNSKGLNRSSGKEKESLRLVSTSAKNVKTFYLIVVQWWQRNVQKSMMHEQSCFLRRRLCLNSLLPNLTSPQVLTAKKQNADIKCEVWLKR